MVAVLGGSAAGERTGLPAADDGGLPTQFAWKVGGLRPRTLANAISIHVLAWVKVRGGPSLRVEGARRPWTPPHLSPCPLHEMQMRTPIFGQIRAQMVVRVDCAHVMRVQKSGCINAAENRTAGRGRFRDIRSDDTQPNSEAARLFRGRPEYGGAMNTARCTDGERARRDGRGGAV